MKSVNGKFAVLSAAGSFGLRSEAAAKSVSIAGAAGRLVTCEKVHAGDVFDSKTESVFFAVETSKRVAVGCGYGNRVRFCKRSAFTLVESVLAIALFSLASFFITTTCYNLLWGLDINEKDAEFENLVSRAIEAITSVSDYDALDDGVDVETFDGDTCRVYGVANPTEIIDLFELEVKFSAKNNREFSKKILVLRPNWYQNSNDRDKLVRDRTDFLDETRRKDDFRK